MPYEINVANKHFSHSKGCLHSEGVTAPMLLFFLRQGLTVNQPDFKFRILLLQFQVLGL